MASGDSALVLSRKRNLYVGFRMLDSIWMSHKPLKVFKQRSMDISPFYLSPSAPPPDKRSQLRGSPPKMKHCALITLFLWTWSEYTCGFWGSQEVTPLSNSDISPFFWSHLHHLSLYTLRCSLFSAIAVILSFAHPPLLDGHVTSYSFHWGHLWPSLSLTFIVM